MLSYAASQLVNPIMIILTIIFVITAIIALFKNKNKLFAIVIFFLGLNSILRQILISDFSTFRIIISSGLIAIGILLFYVNVKENKAVNANR